MEINKFNAEIEISKIFGTGFRLLQSILSFYNTATAGLSDGSREQILKMWESMVYLYNTKELHTLLKEPESAKESLQKINENLPVMQQKLQDDVQKNINAASIVFAHGVIEEFVNGYLTITSQIKPESWEYLIRYKEMKIESFKNNSYEEIRNKAIKKLLQQEIRYKPLIGKLDLLHKITPPQGDILSSNDSFSYDRNRIIKLDNIRHQIVHGNDWDITSINFKIEYDYWFRLNSYLAALVCKGTGLKIFANIVWECLLGLPSNSENLGHP